MNLDSLLKRIETTDITCVRGKVCGLTGLSIVASIPGVRLGERVRISRQDHTSIDAEVIGFSGDDAMLLPMGPTAGIGPDDIVESTGRPFEIRCSEQLLGRVLDGLGRPIDGGPELSGEVFAIERQAPAPLDRPRIERKQSLGIRAIDGLLTVGQGQRVGLFAGSGVGKSTLMGQIARQADADVFVVCLIGERGREVREFIEDSLGQDGLKRGVVVCATSDAPALVRLKCASTATAVAEWFRDRGKRVVLLMDSLTRFARAAREVGLCAGEPPARRGYPPSVFARLPELLERTGNNGNGSITAFYTVLVEGSDMEEPIADEVRGILDGHIVLRRELAERGHWPAIDVLQSLSRVMRVLVDAEHQKAADTLRAHLALYESKRDLVLLGAYERGSDERLDAALRYVPAIEAFLRQDSGENCPFDVTVEELKAAMASA